MRDFRLFASAMPVLVLVVGTLVWHAGGPSASAPVEARGPANVLLAEGLESKLSAVYSVAEKEIPLCLFGAESERGTILERMAFPDQLSTTDSTATFDGASCEARPDFLGYVHNHDPPASRCTPTPLDEARFALNADSRVEVIACTRASEITYHAFVP
jgi:hypothetical protein